MKIIRINDIIIQRCTFEYWENSEIRKHIAKETI